MELGKRPVKKLLRWESGQLRCSVHELWTVISELGGGESKSWKRLALGGASNGVVS